MTEKMSGTRCYYATPSKILFLIHNLYVILGSVYFINVRHCLQYGENAIKTYDSDLYLVIALGCIGVSGGIASLLIECPDKRYKALLCLILWNTFQGICLVLSLSNIYEGKSLRNGKGVEFAACIIYITVYASLCVAELFFINREYRQSKSLQNSDLL